MMDEIDPPADPALDDANAAIAWALAHPDIAGWMREPLSLALRVPPIDVARQVDLLKHLVDRRAHAWLTAAYAGDARSLPPAAATGAA